ILLSAFKFVDKLIKPELIKRIDLITYSKKVSTPRFILDPVNKLGHRRVTRIVKFIYELLESNLPLAKCPGHSGGAFAGIHLLLGQISGLSRARQEPTAYAHRNIALFGNTK
ncbi:MAG: hypothetical protein V3W08_11070, partial [Candidatus Binatia bacterium]